MMRITIKSNKPLNEVRGAKRDIYEVLYKMKLAQDANFEQIKTDIRAIKGVAIVSSVAGSKQDFETFERIVYKIKFVPYQTPLRDFLRNLENSFTKLSTYGLMAFQRVNIPKKQEK
tara:strand:+ start:158 stop:505 length:348 start_codon:yes stop_codon:yes gene_type:complete